MGDAFLVYEANETTVPRTAKGRFPNLGNDLFMEEGEPVRG